MSLIEKRLINEIITKFTCYSLPKHETLLVAFSGGPDSTALLSITVKLRELYNYSVKAVYVAHNLRAENEQQAEINHVHQICSDFAVNLLCKEFKAGEIRNYASSHERSIEEAARDYRYNYFDQVLSEHPDSLMLLGHTLDEQHETLFMRILQGSGIDGLTGIPVLRGLYLRPFLDITKHDLMDYLDEKSISFFYDSTNKNIEYMRNRFRNTLMPIVDHIFPGYFKGLEIFREKMEWTRQALDKYLPSIEIKDEKDGSVSFGVEQFLKSIPYVRLKTLYDCWMKLAHTYTDMLPSQLPYRFVRKLIDISEVEENSTIREKIILQGHGTVLVKQQNRFFWKRAVVLTKKKRYLKVIDYDDTGRCPPFLLKYVHSLAPEKDVIAFYTDNIIYPVVVRSKEDGDLIYLKHGTVALKKLFNEWGVDVDKRWTIPIIEDRKGIKAVLGKPWGYPNRFASGCIAADYRKKTGKDKKVLAFYFTH